MHSFSMRRLLTCTRIPVFFRLNTFHTSSMVLLTVRSPDVLVSLISYTPTENRSVLPDRLQRIQNTFIILCADFYVVAMRTGPEQIVPVKLSLRIMSILMGRRCSRLVIEIAKFTKSRHLAECAHLPFCIDGQGWRCEQRSFNFDHFLLWAENSSFNRLYSVVRLR